LDEPAPTLVPSSKPQNPNVFEVGTKLNPTFELLDLSNTPLSKKHYFFFLGQNGGTQVVKTIDNIQYSIFSTQYFTTQKYGVS
jgi:hypothetical protein